MPSTTLRSIYDMPTISFNYSAGRLAAAATRHADPSAALNQRISLIRQDMTTLSLDAIVNAANKNLTDGGGINGEIHRAAGQCLVEACNELRAKIKTCKTGSSVVTNGFNLPAKFIVHAVGPDNRDAVKAGMPPDAEALESCYKSCLSHAEKYKWESIGLCCLSASIYAYPPKEAAEVACRTVRNYLETSEVDTLKRVVFVVFGVKDMAIYKQTLPQYFPPTDPRC